MSNFDKEENKVVTLKQYDSVMTHVEREPSEIYNSAEYIEKLQSELDYLDQKVIIEHYRRELGDLHYKYSALWDTNRELEKQIDKINKGENNDRRNSSSKHKK